MRLASRCACVLALASLSTSWLAACDASDDRDELRDPSDHERDRSRSDDRGSLSIRAFETSADARVTETDGGSASANEPDAPADAGLQYSDEELVGMVVAIHEAETLLGRAGALGTTDPQLKALATDVADAHQAGRARALLLGLLPLPSQQSRDYLESGLSLRTHLRGEESGEPFDRAYLECQIMLNAIVIHHIESLFLPMADSEELRSELTSTRDTMQLHLDSAVALRGALYPVPPALDDDAGTSEPGNQDAGLGEEQDAESREPVDAGRDESAGDEGEGDAGAAAR